MKLRRFSISAAMEQLEELETVAVDTPPTEVDTDIPTEPVEEVDIPVAEDTVETAVSDMDMAESEVNQADDAIDGAETDLGTLTDVADKLEATDETGGVDAASAAVIEVAVEALYERLGITNGKAMVSMESFGASSSRKRATQIAVENIREQAKNVGKAILVMIQKAWEFISNFFSKVFTASGRVRERATKLKEALAKIKGKSNSAEVDGSTFGSQLVYAYKDTITAKDIVTGLNKTDSNGLKKIQERSLVTANSLADFQALIAGTPDEFAAKIAPQFDFSSFDRIVDVKDYETPSEGVAYYAVTDVDGLLGGNSIAIMAQEVVGTDFESVSKAVNSTKVITKNQLSDKQQEAETYAKLATLSIDDCNAIIDGVLSAMDAVDKLKANSDSIVKTGETLRKVLSGEVFSTLIDKEIGTEEKKDAATGYFVLVRAAIKTMTALASQPLLFMGKATVTSASAALQYVALSAKTYAVAGETADAKPADEPAPKEDTAPAAPTEPAAA